MIVAKEFFALQLTFAEHVCALWGMPFEQALLEHTNLYTRLGLGREHDATHPVWRAYLAGLRTTGNQCDYTYDFYLEDPEATTAPPILGKFGCFSWGLEGSEVLRLHFRNEERGPTSPLSTSRRDARKAELAALFAHTKSRVSNAPKVMGISWLYNLEAYRRLFPPAYGESRRAVRTRGRGMSLWGQFLDHRGELKRNGTEHLLSSLARQASLGEVHRCFPLQVLGTEAPIQQFYAFYGL